jgi:parallel beta-helix repeat protein
MTNVKDFGAAGDGQTDDTDSIRHAVEQGDGVVTFPRGTYRITAPISVELGRHGRTAFDGARGTAKLVMDSAGPAIRLVGSHAKTAAPSDFQPGTWEMERMPMVSDIEIVGNHPESDGIELEGTMQATLRGLLIRRCRYGVHLVKRNRNVLLANSHIYDGRGAAIGVFFDGVNLHQANIIGCHISYCAHAGIKIERSEIRNLQITGNDIEYNFDPNAEDSADVWIDSRDGTVREGTIASNTIQAKYSPHGANVRIEGLDNEPANKAGLWTISGNVIQSQAVNLMLRRCRGVVVTGNSFCSGYERSLVLEKCRHIVVGCNTFDHNPDYSGDRIDGITVRGSAGCSFANLILESTRAGSATSGGALEIFDSREISVTGCQILDPVFRGIYLSDSKNTRINDNTILDRRATASMLESIRIAGASGAVVIRNNIIAKGTAGDSIVHGSGVTVSDNTEPG